jgi:hypothetical protein
MMHVSGRGHPRRWGRRGRAVKLNGATALLISRAAWRMYRGRWPWSAGARRWRVAWHPHR